MRVLVLPSYYGRRGDTLRGSFFREQAIALARNGNAVTVVHVFFDSEGGVWTEAFDDEGVRTILVHAKPLPGRVNPLYRVWLLRNAYNRLVAPARSVDVIHAHVFLAAFDARWLAASLGLPYVVTEHSTRLQNGPWPRLDRLMARMGYDGADALIAVSEGLRDRMAQFTEKRVTVIPNLVGDGFLSSPPRATEGGRPFRFLSVAYLRPQKGIDTLIRAFADIQPADSGATLTIAGGGEQEAELQQLARSLGVDDLVHFPGRLSRDEIMAEMDRCHAFVLPSRQETFGVVFIEALARGKPVIMTQTDAASAIVNPANGFSVPIDDVGCLSDALRRMMAEYDRFDPQWIQQDCRDRFSEAAVCEALRVTYEGAVVRHVRRSHVAKQP